MLFTPRLASTDQTRLEMDISPEDMKKTAIDPRSNLMAIIAAEAESKHRDFEPGMVLCRMFRVAAERKAESQQSLIDRRTKND